MTDETSPRVFFSKSGIFADPEVFSGGLKWVEIRIGLCGGETEESEMWRLVVVSVMDATGLKSIWKLLAFEELDLSKEVEKKVKKITAEEIVVIINAKKTLVDLMEKLLCLSISRTHSL